MIHQTHNSVCIIIFDPRFDTNLDFCFFKLKMFLCNISIISVHDTPPTVSDAQYWQTEPEWRAC